MEKVFEIYIKTTPERLWEAITDPEHAGASTTSASGSRVGLDARARSYEACHPPAPGALDRRARTSRSIRRGGSSRASTRSGATTSRREGTSRVTWEIQPVGDSCRLTVTHDQLREGANDQLFGGWPMILSGLKTCSRRASS